MKSRYPLPPAVLPAATEASALVDTPSRVLAPLRSGAGCVILEPGATTALRIRPFMYITDAKHFLDDKGAIAPRRGPAKAMVDFHAGVIAYATDYEDTGVAAAQCFKCKKSEVQIARALDDAIVWSCPRCSAEGRISNWQGTLWDLSERPDAAS